MVFALFFAIFKVKVLPYYLKNNLMFMKYCIDISDHYAE